VLNRLDIFEHQRPSEVRDRLHGRPLHQVHRRLNLEALVDPALDLERANALGTQPRRFGQRQDLVRRHILHFLHHPRRPFDAERVHLGRVAEAQVGVAGIPSRPI
jgi:hypothetical protein